jgi:hypothetical protein
LLCPAAAASPRFHTTGRAHNAPRRSPPTVSAPPLGWSRAPAQHTPRRRALPRASLAQGAAQAPQPRPASQASARARCDPSSRSRTPGRPRKSTAPPLGARSGRGCVRRPGHRARAAIPMNRRTSPAQRWPPALRVPPPDRACPRTPRAQSAASFLVPAGGRPAGSAEADPVAPAGVRAHPGGAPPGPARLVPA